MLGTGGSVIIQGMVWVVTASWGCRGACQIAGALSCYQDILGEKTGTGIAYTRYNSEKIKE
jgi:hypothetical protein